jgi:hypothetical protein
MGSPGHAFIAHTKALSPRAQAKDAGYGPPPHPLSARAGQHYWPRSGRRRVLLVVRRVERDRVILRSSGESAGSTSVTLRRLLAQRTDGQGRHYQFQGYSSRRYDTKAYVCSIVDGYAVLCVPEWHPRRPVRFPMRLLPDSGRNAGAWLVLRCDLSASTAARLQPSDLVAIPSDIHPEGLPVPDLAG